MKKERKKESKNLLWAFFCARKNGDCPPKFRRHQDSGHDSSVCRPNGFAAQDQSSKCRFPRSALQTSPYDLRKTTKISTTCTYYREILTVRALRSSRTIEYYVHVLLSLRTQSWPREYSPTRVYKSPSMATGCWEHPWEHRSSGPSTLRKESPPGPNCSSSCRLSLNHSHMLHSLRSRILLSAAWCSWRVLLVTWHPTFNPWSRRSVSLSCHPYLADHLPAMMWGLCWHCRLASVDWESWTPLLHSPRSTPTRRKFVSH